MLCHQLAESALAPSPFLGKVQRPQLLCVSQGHRFAGRGQVVPRVESLLWLDDGHGSGLLAGMEVTSHAPAE